MESKSMNDYMIFVDLSADMSVEYAKENNIGFVPMQYMIGAEEKVAKYIETEENLKTFYDAQRNGSETKTTQVTPFQYVEFFKEYCEKKIDIMYFTLSSGLSKTYSSALLAREELLESYPDAKIEVIDSRAATGGISVLVDRALKNKNNGIDVEANAAIMKKEVERITHWFVVEDLMFLKRGGRISAATAVFGTALNIKPILKVNSEGKLESVSKKHGMKKGLLDLVDRFIADYDDTNKVVYVCHSDAKDNAEFVKSKLVAHDPQLDVRVLMLSPIIGAHTGPGMCAVCYLRKNA